MRDICKRSTVNKCRSSLKSLNKVGGEGIAQKRRHSPCRLQITRGYGFSVNIVCNNHSGQTHFQILKRGCKTENCHNLTCNCNIVAIHSRHSVNATTESVLNTTKLTVIHINTTTESDFFGVNSKFVALINMVIKHGTKQVICRTNRVEVTCKMKIYILHWHNLGISTACSTTLDAKNGAQGGLTKCSNHTLS